MQPLLKHFLRNIFANCTQRKQSNQGANQLRYKGQVDKRTERNLVELQAERQDKHNSKDSQIAKVNSNLQPTRPSTSTWSMSTMKKKGLEQKPNRWQPKKLSFLLLLFWYAVIAKYSKMVRLYVKTTAVTVQLENQVGPSTSNVRSPEVTQ